MNLIRAYSKVDMEKHVDRILLHGLTRHKRGGMLLDQLARRYAALTDVSDIANRLTGGNSGTPEHLWHFFDSRIQSAAATATVASRMTSLWRYNKTNGASAGIPTTTAAKPTRTTLGALGQANPGGGRQKWLLGVELSCLQPGTLIIYDRLLHVGGLSGTVTTAQTVGGGTVDRYAGANSVGNQIWIEIYTQIGATGTTITASYTDQGSAAGNTTQAASIGATGLREAERLIPVPLADGDTGVEAVASVTLAATTGTAGDFGVTVARPLAVIPCGGSGMPAIRDLIAGLPSIPEILTDACLAFAFFAQGTTAPSGMIGVHSIEK